MSKDEQYPKGWVNVNLMINPKTNEIHAVGGDREPGKGDTPYIGLEIIKKLIKKAKPYEKGNWIITGRADAGKTTLANQMKKLNGKAIVLDGDDMRVDFPCGFSDKEREEHIMRMGRFANILNRQGFEVIIAAVLPKKEWRVKLTKLIKKRCSLIYIPGGHLWKGTTYEEPTEDENPAYYNWRKGNKS
jgi:hypothetical protein